MRKITHIVIHCSDSKDHNDGNELQRFDGWHKKRGFSKSPLSELHCGYHRIISYKNGVPVCEFGRFISEKGIHAVGFNSNSIAVCVTGKYDNKPVEKDKWLFLIRHVIILMRGSNVPIINIIGHHETYTLRHKRKEKSCPGKRVSMTKLRADIQQQIEETDYENV